MYIQNYLVKIVSTKNKNIKYDEDSNGYVLLPHNEKYSINLRNFKKTRCEARVEIDGEHMGTWVLNPKESITLERGVEDTGYFTFFRVGSKKAAKAGLEEVHKNLLGLVSVTFTPEKEKPIPVSYTFLPYNPDKWEPIKPWRNNKGLRKSTDDTAEYGAGEIRIGSSSGIGGSSARSFNYSTEVLDFAEPAVASADCAPMSGSLTAGGTGLSGDSDQKFITVAGLNLNKSEAVTINLRLVCAEQKEKVRPKKAYSTPVPPPIDVKVQHPFSYNNDGIRKKKRGA